MFIGRHQWLKEKAYFSKWAPLAFTTALKCFRAEPHAAWTPSSVMVSHPDDREALRWSTLLKVLHSASPPLQTGLDAEVHEVQVWGGGGAIDAWPKTEEKQPHKSFEWGSKCEAEPRLAGRRWGCLHTPTQSMVRPLHSGDEDTLTH